MDTIQQDAVSNPGSPSTVIPPTPAPRRGKKVAGGKPKKDPRSSNRATPMKKAAPAQTSPASKPVLSSPATPAKGSPKRKAGEGHGSGSSPTKRARPAKVIVKYHGDELRPHPWRDSPPDSYLDKVDRIGKTRYVVASKNWALSVLTDRLWGLSMFIVGRQVHENGEVPEFYFDVVGSTGNLYRVKIGKLPSCDCPDAKFRGRGECKHVIYGTSSILNSTYSSP